MNIIRHQLVQFIIMVIIGVVFNPMNILAYRVGEIYLSLTLFYGGLLMASNMMWAHELVHYFSMGHFNINVFLIGILFSIFVAFLLLRQQFLVNDRQWIRRMISHHSTALTTSHNIFNKTNDNRIKNLAKGIIETQENEITFMKKFLN
jgi:hypothetical protein